MEIKFFKASCLGADYIIIDNRGKKYNKLFQNRDKIAQLCDEEAGIGASGVAEITRTAKNDIEVKFYGSAGSPAKYGGTSACCVADFARLNGLLQQDTFTFICDNNEYKTHWNRVENNYIVTFKDIRRDGIVQFDDECYEVFAGCPHVVKFVKNVQNVDVLQTLREISNREMFRKYGGTNVNFVENTDGEWKVRTFCRSSDSELSVCGSGSVSVAVVCEHIRSEHALTSEGNSFEKHKMERTQMKVRYPGGTIEVQFNVDFQNYIFSDINLTLTAFSILHAKIEL